ncbi:MAG: hypothetical protein ACFFB6_05000 [Promethearchaeota archaeon]
MVQVLEDEEIYVFIPEVEEKAEKVKEKAKKVKRKVRASKYGKFHEKEFYINKIKNNLDARIIRGNFFPQ